jgi:rod shape determining protein RodA
MASTRRINVDLPLIIAASLLSAYGLAVVFSAGKTDVRTVAANAYRAQAMWLTAGIVLAFAISRASVRMIEWLTVPIYGLTVALLAGLLLGLGSGAGTATSTTGWLTIGGHRLGQPAEFAKLSVVLMLARVLAQNRVAPRSMIELWKPLVVAGVPLLLIMAQGDLGTSIVFVGIFFAMLFWAGVTWQLLVLLASPVVSLILGFDPRIWGAWFLLLLALVLWYKPFLGEGLFVVAANVIMGIAGPVLWEHLKPYRQLRLRVFLDPTIDPRGASYHVIQSQIAIGSGGWFGVTVALALFAFLFLRVIRVAERANDSFSSLVAFGLLASWFTHVLENIGMTLSLMPVTGIPLPFFSYGGSFMLACWMAIGVLARVSSEGRGGKTGPFRV